MCNNRYANNLTDNSIKYDTKVYDKCHLQLKETNKKKFSFYVNAT